MKKYFYVGMMIFIALVSCNKGGNSGPANGSNNNTGGPAPVTTTFDPQFTASIIDTASLDYIIPLGNLNPVAGHITPSDHIYFVIRRNGNTVPQVPVYAAGSGTITQINGYTDGGVYISFNNNQIFWYGHVNLDNSLKVGSVVKAGEKIGLTSGQAAALDLGLQNSNLTILPRLLNPERYQTNSKYCVDPLTYYTPALQSYFYSKSVTHKNQKGGKIDFGIAGTLKGDWFDESQTYSQTLAGGPSSWNMQLAFVPDNIDTTLQRVSIGGTPGGAGNNLSLPGLFAVKSDAPLFESVKQATGLIKYQLFQIGDNTFTNPLGVLLVQIIDMQKIKVETTTNLGATAFSGAAKNYVR